MSLDMFLHEETPEGGAMLLDASKVWKMPTTAPVYYPPVQQRTRGQYRSRSNTTSSSVSSLDERLSAGDSPDQLFMASSSQRQTSVSNTSSSPTRSKLSSIKSPMSRFYRGILLLCNPLMMYYEHAVLIL